MTLVIPWFSSNKYLVVSCDHNMLEKNTLRTQPCDWNGWISSSISNTASQSVNIVIVIVLCSSLKADWNLPFAICVFRILAGGDSFVTNTIISVWWDPANPILSVLISFFCALHLILAKPIGFFSTVKWSRPQFDMKWPSLWQRKLN